MRQRVTFERVGREGQWVGVLLDKWLGWDAEYNRETLSFSLTSSLSVYTVGRTHQLEGVRKRERERARDDPVKSQVSSNCQI